MVQLRGFNQIVWACILIIIASTGAIRNKSRALTVAVFAMKKSNKNVPDLSLQMAQFYGLHIAAYSRAIIQSKYVHGQMGNGDCYKIDLRKMNISSLFDWDFSGHRIFLLDLSRNQLRRISDAETSFPNTAWYEFPNNRIKHVDLRKTKITQLELTNNRLSDWAHILLPPSLVTLIIDDNPIQSISNYHFTVLKTVTLTGCNITSLENLVFNTEHVFLSNNPIQSIKNVTFTNGNIVTMINCGITLSKLKEFELHFVPLCYGQFSELILSNNNMTGEQLLMGGYVLPYGLNRIVLDGEHYNRQFPLIRQGIEEHRGVWC